MSTTDDRADKALPVTGEVGSEGGSYGDPTLQVATFEERLPRTGRAGGAGSTAGEANDRGAIAEGGVGTAPDPNSGMIRFPTEPPAPPSATEGLRIRGFDWRAGVIGAAVGAGLALTFRRRT
jgi:hypothetical protein